MRRGRGAGLGGERAPPTAHTGNGKEKANIKKKDFDLIIQLLKKESIIHLLFICHLINIVHKQQFMMLQESMQ